MKAIYKGKEVDVWQVGRNSFQPNWVKHAFSHGGLCWIGSDKVKIYWPAINPSKKGIIRTILNGISASFVGISGGGVAVYDIGFEGDVIDFTNSKVVTAEKFAKNYQIVSRE
ncbi:hypothetical protein [Ligilactobacillus salivarius]|uniref:hypothetical protein n=1 Tax=Ligilactobacillus salivarius TaxID=1624 RepID=UPI00202338FE|nr:hypothetical protein [Ligilactobacillus salivarius]URI13677.1 hypothetical protein M9Y03_08360 [Ligilactobacillus salivarius]UUB35523.1 hypothetical protein NO469_08510 [Ligilactobacillus salivarius]